MIGAASSSMLTAVLSDQSQESTRGRLSGIVGLFSGAGALLALFVFLRLPTVFDSTRVGLQYTYLIVAGISGVFALFLFWALAERKAVVEADSGELEHDPPAEGDCVPGVSRSSSCEQGVSRSSSCEPGVSRSSSCEQGGSITSSQSEEIADPQDTGKRTIFPNILKDGILAIKNPRIFLGYMAGFLARGDTVVLSVFFPLWVYSYFIRTEKCADFDPANPAFKTDCREAYVAASILTGVAQTCALVGAPFFGILSDKVYRPFSVLLATVIGGGGYFWLYFIDRPMSTAAFVAAGLVGFGEIGNVVCSLSLVASPSVPKASRGSVAGVYSAFGAAGILFNTKIGGILFDQWHSAAPFFLMGTAHVVVIMLGLFVAVNDFLKRSP